MIDVAPNASAADCDGARCRINARVFDPRQIDDEAVVTNSQTSRVVTATTDRKQEIIVSGEIYRMNYVCYVCTICHQTRLFMDHAVVNLPSFIIILVARLYQSAPQVRFEIGNSIFVKHDEVSLKESDGQDGESRHFH